MAATVPTLASPVRRWIVLAGLLLPEYLALSFVVDLPTEGPAVPLAHAVRMVVPVVLGAIAAGWLLSHSARRSLSPALELPPFRAGPLLILQPTAFVATLALAHGVLGPRAQPPTAGPLLAILAALLATAILGVAAAFPVRWVLRAAALRWRFPLLAVAAGVLVWRGAVAAETLWGVLSGGTLQAAAFLLRATPFTVTVDTARDMLGVGDFLVHVAPVCSGADGLGLVVLFQGIWMSLARRSLRFPHALLLLPLGAAAALAANVLRLSLLLVAGASGFAPLAAGGLHSKLGWILFIGLALGSVVLAERIRWIRRDEPSPRAEQGEIPPAAAAYVGPLLATLVAALLSSMVAQEGFDPAYGLRVIAGAAALLAARRALPAPTIAFDPRPIAIGLAVAALWIFAVGGEARPLPAALAAVPEPLRSTWIAVRLLGACVLIPVVEELAFRGFLLRWLVSSDFERVGPRAFSWPALLVSSLAFGALHDDFLLGVAAGLAFAGASIWRGRLSDAIAAHAAANAAIAAAVLLGDRWDLWM